MSEESGEGYQNESDDDTIDVFAMPLLDNISYRVSTKFPDLTFRYLFNAEDYKFGTFIFEIEDSVNLLDVVDPLTQYFLNTISNLEFVYYVRRVIKNNSEEEAYLEDNTNTKLISLLQDDNHFVEIDREEISRQLAGLDDLPNSDEIRYVHFIVKLREPGEIDFNTVNKAPLN